MDLTPNTFQASEIGVRLESVVGGAVAQENGKQFPLHTFICWKIKLRIFNVTSHLALAFHHKAVL